MTFDEIREDRAWYLRDSLVKDCISSGCCGRDCRCCENRHLGKLRGRRRGIGHCIIECWCCQVSRGFETNEKEVNEFLKDLKEDMDLPNIYSFITILPLVDDYFILPARYPYGKPRIVSFISRQWKRACSVK